MSEDRRQGLRETVRYWGATAADCRSKFNLEVKARTADGWRVVREATEWPFGKPGLDLVVTYELADAAEPTPAESSVQETHTRSRRALLAKCAPYLVIVAIVVAFANFAWVMWEISSIGDAQNGRQADGHYFVWNKPGFTEVSQATWNWLRLHQASVIVTHPLGILGGWYMVARKRSGEISSGLSPAEISARIREVRESGPMLATASGPGLRLPPIRLTVHPGGIVVKPTFGSEHSILVEEIDNVTPGLNLGLQSVVIWHAGVDFISPLAISTNHNSPIGLAIRGLVEPLEDGD
jgi:hypothetical protein